MERYGSKVGPEMSDTGLSRICLDIGAFDLFSDKICMTLGRFNINMKSTGIIEELSEPDLDNCNSDYILYRIHYPGHVAIALIDILEGNVEIFDSAGIHQQGQIVMSHLKVKFPDLNVIYVNNIDLQSKEDMFCQTYILYYVYLRVIQRLPYPEAVLSLQKLSSEERIDLMRSFFTYLLSVESKSKGELDILPKNVILQICSQLPNKELSDLLVSSSKAFSICNNVMFSRLIDSALKKGVAIELVGPNNVKWILYTDEGKIKIYDDIQKISKEVPDLESMKKWLFDNGFRPGNPLKITINQ